MKIAIIGYSGAGKSTLAKRLAKGCRIPLLYLDQVNFMPGWAERDSGKAKKIVHRFMEQDNWVIDGNYKQFYQTRRLRDADCIVFMNYPRSICFLQALGRYRRHKGSRRESMAAGCNEKFDLEFIRWVLIEGRDAGKRKHYKKIAGCYPDKMIVLKNSKQTERFYEDFLQRSAMEGGN